MVLGFRQSMLAYPTELSSLPSLTISNLRSFSTSVGSSKYLAALTWSLGPCAFLS